METINESTRTFIYITCQRTYKNQNNCQKNIKYKKSFGMYVDISSQVTVLKKKKKLSKSNHYQLLALFWKERRSGRVIKWSIISIKILYKFLLRICKIVSHNLFSSYMSVYYRNTDHPSQNLHNHNPV